jgi:hypothetical protein
MLRNYAVLLVLMCMVISCKKDKSFENPNGVPINEQQWEFKEAATTFGGPMDSGYIRSIGVANSLNLTGTSKDGKGQISLEVLSNGPITKGDYKNPQVLFQYSQSGSLIFQNSSADDFTITITAIDSLSVTGTFSGVVIDSGNTKQVISEGKFTAAIAGFAPLPEGKGTLTVWSKALCEGTGNISIKVGDSAGFITQAMTSEPICGATGTASFELPTGAYTIIAICGTDTLMLDAAVLPDVCSTVEVDFSTANQDYFPLVSRWTYGNAVDPDNDTLAIESSGTADFIGNTYNNFVNDSTGETKYYRKADHIYYQYLPAAFGFVLDTPIELIILKDNVPVNTSWDSDPYQFTPTSGIPRTFTARLTSQITQTGYSATINGVLYKDLIEVMSYLYLQNPDGTYSNTETSIRTVFAKGIGIVSYQDFDDNGSEVDWEIRHFNVSF